MTVATTIAHTGLAAVVDRIPTAVIAAIGVAPWWINPLGYMHDVASAVASVLAAVLVIVKLRIELRKAPPDARTGIAVQAALQAPVAGRAGVFAQLAVMVLALFRAGRDAAPNTPAAPSPGSPLAPSHVEPLWLAKARAEAGTHEAPGDADNARVQGYYARAGHPEVTHDATPWCAAFVGAMLADAGYGGTRSLWARSYLNWGVPCAPKPGAIAVLWRGSPKAETGHVAFVVKTDAEHVYLLGGNQRDAVNVTAYPLNRVLAYRWPKSALRSRTIMTAAGLLGAGAVGYAGGLDVIADTLARVGTGVTGFSDVWPAAPLLGQVFQCLAALVLIWVRVDDLKNKGR